MAETFDGLRERAQPFRCVKCRRELGTKTFAPITSRSIGDGGISRLRIGLAVFRRSVTFICAHPDCGAENKWRPGDFEQPQDFAGEYRR